MTRILVLIAITILIGGCATAKLTRTYTPDGKEGYIINCSSNEFLHLNWGSCYKKAGDACGAKGYEVLEKSEEGASFTGGSVSNRSMIIKCKE
jgi:uncharacterized protein YceK